MAQRIVECLCAIVILAALCVGVLMVTGCAWDADKSRSSADCVIETPQGYVMSCNTKEKTADKEGDILKLNVP